MGGRELGARVRDEAVKRAWRRSWPTRNDPEAPSVVRFVSPLPVVGLDVPPIPQRRLLDAARALRGGSWRVLGCERSDMTPAPDWFADPGTGQHLAGDAYCFDFDLRRGGRLQALKPLWELSRHHHVTVAAAAYHCSGDDRFAVAAADQLRSWWRANPPLTGPMWASGIELGVRLISWVWTRRLLDAWPGTVGLFDANPDFHRQLLWHQKVLDRLASHGSSANNHVVAEAAGAFAAGCALPWFESSVRWRARAAAVLEREVPAQMFPCGVHRELAPEYHAFVLELSLAAGLEGDAAGAPLSTGYWEALARMTDAAAAMVDRRLRPPRQNDGDDGCGLLLDHPDYHRWGSLLATGEALFGRQDWWPKVPAADVRTSLWTALTERRAPQRTIRPARPRPDLTSAGMLLLVFDRGDEDEIWCRLDHGPHGYLATAAHAHADALSIELRHGGVDILADPGTYCYQGQPHWRRYFRSTAAHNTLEVDGVDQSVASGEFLWSSHAQSKLEHLSSSEGDPVARWHASHDGYRRLSSPVTHHRTVHLDCATRRLEIEDRLEGTGRHPVRLTFHLGPYVTCRFDREQALLQWDVDGCSGEATLVLPANLAWACVRGREDRPLGWYSPRFGERVPTSTLEGTGRVAGGECLVTTLVLRPTKPDGGVRACE